ALKLAARLDAQSATQSNQQKAMEQAQKELETTKDDLAKKKAELAEFAKAASDERRTRESVGAVHAATGDIAAQAEIAKSIQKTPEGASALGQFGQELAGLADRQARGEKLSPAEQKELVDAIHELGGVTASSYRKIFDTVAKGND